MNVPTRPRPEFPTERQIQEYGALAFLYLRLPQYADMPVRNLRLRIQPPIDLEQVKVFYHDGVPRSALTWAQLSPEAEAKIWSDDLLTPSEWRSGDSFWVIEMVAPYGRGSGGDMMRWLQANLPDTVTRVRYLRARADGGNRRIVECNRIAAASWGARIVTL